MTASKTVPDDVPRPKNDWRDTELWTRTADGHVICPCCGALVHVRCRQLHADACFSIAAAMGDEPIIHKQ